MTEFRVGKKYSRFKGSTDSIECIGVIDNDNVIIFRDSEGQVEAWNRQKKFDGKYLDQFEEVKKEFVVGKKYRKQFVGSHRDYECVWKRDQRIVFISLENSGGLIFDLDRKCDLVLLDKYEEVKEETNA